MPSRVAGNDRDRALGTDHVLHEEGVLAHHRPPAGLVPADRAVIEGHVQVAVILLVGLRPQLGADAVHAHRLGAGQLAHHVDIVHAAIDDRDQAVDQVLVPAPGRAVALLVEVEAHHQRLAERLAELDELDPARMHAQDVAQHQLLVLRPGELATTFSASSMLVASGFSMNTWAPALIALIAYSAWVFGQRVDRDGVGLGRLQRLVEILEQRIALEFVRDLLAT